MSAVTYLSVLQVIQKMLSCTIIVQGPIPSLQLHQTERWENEIFIQQEKKEKHAQNNGQTFKKPYKWFSTR